MKALLGAFITAALLAGCGTKATNYPLAATETNADRRAIDAEADRPFVVLSFSGGGSRAAVLAAAVTARLDGITYQTPAGPRRLSQDIAVVSSVSGGSVYAADLALRGAGAAEAQAFEKRIGDFDGIGWLEGRALNPATWVQLQFENKTRIDLLQEMLGDVLQTHATLGELNVPGKPLFLFNASDMVAGEIFTFDPQTIDDLCMSFDRMPLTLAATASAAFPIAFTPVLLRNDSYPTCPAKQMPAGNDLQQLKGDGGRYANLEAYRHALYRAKLRRQLPYLDATEPRYIRLLDGGVIDNLGLTSVRRTLLQAGGPGSISPLTQQGKLRHLVVISVNARSDPPNDLSTSNRYTSLATMAGAVADVLVDSASAASAASFSGFVTNLAEERGQLMRDLGSKAAFEIYPISIDFDQLPDTTDTERADKTAVKSIATSWTLQNGNVALLDKVAGELLWRHPCFRKLLKNLGAQGTEEAPAVPGVVCPVPSPATPAS